MRANRQDAWTQDEDDLLAKTVIDYIKKGYTQLESFRYVAEQLNRTAAACGFRWNATIRKRHTKAIEQAKQARKIYLNDALTDPSNRHDNKESQTVSSLDQAIHWLEKLKNESNNQSFQSEGKLKNQIIEENKRLTQELSLYRTVISNIRDQIDTLSDTSSPN